MKSFANLLGYIGGGAAILPWFFSDQLGRWTFGVAGGGYLLILASNGMRSKARWKWDLVLHLIFITGLSLIFLPTYFELAPGIRAGCLIIGLLFLFVVGYNAKMRLIGQGDPALELWLATKEKIKVFAKRNQSLRAGAEPKASEKR